MCIFSREVSFLWTATSWFLLSNLFFQPAPWLSLFKITTVGFLGALSRAYRGTLFMFAPMLPALVLPCSLVPSSSQISSLCFHHRQTHTHTSISVKSRFYIWQNTCDFYFSRFGLTLLNGISASIFNYIWVCVCMSTPAQMWRWEDDFVQSGCLLPSRWLQGLNSDHRAWRRVC